MWGSSLTFQFKTLTAHTYCLVHVVVLMSIATSSGSSTHTPIMPHTPQPPIVYTIAGSDSGGGAGIQADLYAIKGMGCHGCSAVTCLTAQNSVAVTAVHAPPSSFLREQLDALVTDMPPHAVKIGMLGSVELAYEVGKFLEKLCDMKSHAMVVVDPVMISTSGHRLIDEATEKAMVERVFPFANILTPNKYEAEALLGRKLVSPQDIEEAAADILKMGVRSVLIKGGHTLVDDQPRNDAIPPDVNVTLGYAQDYFLSSDIVDPINKRLCDGSSGVWLRSKRYDSEHTHGTGCTLSSAIASALALGIQQRHFSSDNSIVTGEMRAMYGIDACCVGKAYVSQGIGRGVQLGQGPGPVVHTEFPYSSKHFPNICLNPADADPKPFRKMTMIGTGLVSEAEEIGFVMPIVDSLEWVEKLAKIKGIKDLQLRIKGEKDRAKIFDIVKKANDICIKHGIRLWINDFWEAAVGAKCYGVHLGQEDLASCVERGGLEKLKESQMALGISTHSFAELSVALGIFPSYISLGPVFGTTSKSVAFDPQGLETVSKWRALIPDFCPLVVIGGINNPELAKQVKEAGADCVAVIGAVTKASDIQKAVDSLNSSMK